MRIERATALLLLFLMSAHQPLDAQSRRRLVRRDPPSSPAPEAKHYRGGSSRSGVYVTNGPQTLAGVKWQAQTASASFNAPVFAGGALYLNDGAGRMMAFDAETGAVRWRTPFLSSIISSPTVTSDAVYIGVDTRAVIALSVTDGHEVARFSVDSEVFASPLIHQGTLYVATESGALYAFDPATQRQKWRFAGAGPAHGHPAAWAGTVYFGSGGTLIAVGSDGQEKWRFKGPADFFSPSLGVAELTLVGSSGNRVFAFDALTGSQRWSYTSPSPDTGFSAPVLFNGLAIFGTIAPTAMIALNADIGTVVWQTPLQGLIEPILAGNTLYGGAGDYSQNANPNATQKVYAFDGFTGQQRWSADVAGQVKSGLAVGDGKLFVHTQARNLYAFH